MRNITIENLDYAEELEHEDMANVTGGFVMRAFVGVYLTVQAKHLPHPDEDNPTRDAEPKENEKGQIEF
jgi:hypothetical protein